MPNIRYKNIACRTVTDPASEDEVATSSRAEFALDYGGVQCTTMSCFHGWCSLSVSRLSIVTFCHPGSSYGSLVKLAAISG